MNPSSKQVLSPELQQAFLDLLATTLLLIRNSPADAELCEALSDHLHNVPRLLGGFRIELLVFYWEVERSSFLARLRATNRNPPRQFDQPWQIIEREYCRLSQSRSDVGDHLSDDCDDFALRC
jgi:hypothetical protein